MRDPGTQEAARRPGSAPRPLRWAKFTLYLAVGAATLAIAAPQLRELARLTAGPFSDAPPPVPPPLLWGCVALVAGVALVWLVLDAALDRRVPLAVLGLELAAFGVALAGPAFTASPPPGLAGQAGSVQVAFLVARLRERCAAELVGGGQIPADSGALEAELRRALPRTNYRDRWLAQLPPRVVVLTGREGPVLLPLPNDGPGTIYLAIAGAGTFGWVSGVALAGEPQVPGILRNEGRPVIGGVTRPDPLPDGEADLRETGASTPQMP